MATAWPSRVCRPFLADPATTSCSALAQVSLGVSRIYQPKPLNLLIAAEHIYVWDRDTTLLLHRIQIPQRLGHLTAFTWNRRSDVWMFATGTHEGAIHLWTIPPEETQTRGRPSRAKSMPPWSFERTFSGATGISAISSRTASPQGLRSMLEAYPGRPESPAQAGPPQWEDTGNVSGQGPRRRDTVL